MAVILLIMMAVGVHS